MGETTLLILQYSQHNKKQKSHPEHLLSFGLADLKDSAKQPTFGYISEPVKKGRGFKIKKNKIK